MRVPIILMLLVVFLLPADVRSFTNDVAAHVNTASLMLGRMLDRSSSEENVASAASTKVAELR